MLLEVGYFNTSSVDIKYSGTASGGAWNATQSAEASGVDLSAIIKFAENYFGRIGLHNSRIDELAGFTAAGFTYTAAGSSSGSGFLIGGGVEKPMGTKSFWNVELVYYDSLGGVSDATATFLNFGIGMNF